MENNKKNRPMGHVSEINPILIQSYFDGELESDELEALSLEAITSHPMLEALSELREVVRYDSQRGLEDINDMALLNAIHRQIASEKIPTIIPKATETPRTLGSRLGTRLKKSTHWAPAFIGAALLLLSIPGLTMFFTSDETTKTDEHATIACGQSDGNGQSASFVASQNDMPLPNIGYDTPLQDKIQAPSSVQVAAPRVQMQNNNAQQLTVQEMDFAIQHLINRIESLENAKHNPYDTGEPELPKPAFDINL